ncbi:RDD family protein [Paenibacillus koleovorans]|uniref:RDD family protein n=1 Tax=Paenibacillus koleovorans TaxID=121608 RepID=UPI000FD905D7|nr:RDD family protein [Paenibacillus koleovorans]
MSVKDITQNYGIGILLRRWVALWLDGAIMFGFLVLVEIMIGREWYSNSLGLWIVCLIAYFFLLEAKYGQTLGKWVMRIIVVTEDGKTPGFVKSIIRNIVKLLEANPLMFGGLLAGIVSWISSNKQRIGDKWARTYVVRVSDLTRRSISKNDDSMRKLIQEIQSE